MIRIDSIWLATEPMDMQAGTETALARVVAVFGAEKLHCAYLLANRRANRMKVLVHDGVGIWLAARRLNQGRFFWSGLVWSGLVCGTATKLSWMPSNFRPWYSVYLGSESAPGELSRCSNLCRGLLASAIGPSVYRR